MWLPDLETDPRPQELTVSSVENQREINAAFHRRFGNPDHVVVLLVSAIALDGVMASVHTSRSGSPASTWIT